MRIKIQKSKIKSCFKLDDYDIILSETYLSKGKARLIALVKRNTYRELKLTNNKENELIALISMDKKRVVAGVYRPFKTDNGETERGNFERLMTGLSGIDYRKKVIVLGDLNIDFTKKSRFSDEVLEFVDNKGLELKELGITRIRKVRETVQSSAIDHIVTNISEIKYHKEFIGLSDHCLIRVVKKTNALPI